ncbi:TRAP transporter substrate-binding protein [Thalassospira sp. NFXS8]|uniref:TRAP transporter substrate-binding protein n=1 Tax=Thalassospira sp. NFXS8 TaxID=2819093 RepID=UPI0032DF05D0
MKIGIITSALIAFGASVAPYVSANATEVLRLGHIRDTNYPTHLAALKFADIVNAKTNGEIEVKIYPNSQLGGAKDMFVQMQTGDLEMVYGGINTLAWINGGEAFEATAIPFLYRDYAHMKGVLDSEIFAPIINAAEKDTGIKIIAINGETAPRGLTANRAISTAADFKGLKIRTAASPTVLRAMQTLGAIPQQIPFSDLYLALKTGVVDAQENGAAVVDSASLYEVQQYYMKTDYIRDIETFFMSSEKWEELSDEQQNIIADAAETAGNYETELLNELMASVYDRLSTKMKIVDPDLDSIRDALSGAFDNFEGDKWPKGLIKAIAAYE